MCFFQEKFQESLKKLRQEQQEAEKLTAVIREKRASWKVREILLKVSWDGNQGRMWEPRAKGT